MPRVRLGEGIVGYAALHREPVLVADVSQDPRYIRVVPDVRSELAIPMLHQGSLHRRRRPREPRARRVQQARRRDPDAARQPGGGRDRERAAVRGAARQRSAAREGSALRAARADCAAADRAAEAAEGRRGRGGVRSGARGRRRLPRLPGAGVEHAGRRRRRRVGQGRAGGALQRVRRRARARPHVPPPLPARALEPGERAGVDQHDPAPAPARGVLLHALLHDLRSEAAHDDDGQLRAAVSGALLGDELRADRVAGRAARIVRRDRPTTR